MKNVLLVAALTLISAHSFAQSIESTVARVQTERDARCELVKTSKKMCTGSMTSDKIKYCFYNVKFDCVSEEAPFGLKLKVVKESDINSSSETVRKVIIIK